MAKQTKLYDSVKDLLMKYPKLRDSDRLLIWNVWGMGGYVKQGAITKEDFLRAPHTESIRRVRQKIQEQHPELQSSEEVRFAKKEKEKKKGNFVYQEQQVVKSKPKRYKFVGNKAIEIDEEEE
jgi:hypothetical protein